MKNNRFSNDHLEDGFAQDDFLEDNVWNTDSESSGDKFGMKDNNYFTLMHLSQFFGYFIPLLGLIAPLFLWLRNKDQDPRVDAHGRMIINWMVTLLIYYTISILAIFFIVGIFLIFIPLVLSFLFPIIGALEANKGNLWKYPLSFKFL